jgi:inhibitor of KinA sporulation pathway (predicted exonuclease)
MGIRINRRMGYALTDFEYDTDAWEATDSRINLELFNGDGGEDLYELTTITPEMVSDAGTLAEALDKLHDEYDTPNRLWASWGDYDRTMFEKECERKGLDYPFGRSHQNAKTLFGLMYGYKKAPGMTRALKRLDFELEGTHHRGHDDAYNIARILRECLKGP